MRRQSRVSSHASLPEHKSEAASNERSTRSRTSTEDLVILELPKIIRTKRTAGHLRHGGEGYEPIKNGKGNAVIVPSMEGEASKRGLRSTDHSVANNKDMTVAVDHVGGGDAKNPGRARRRSGRLSISQDKEDLERALAFQPDVQKESRSLRRRARSGTSVEHVGNGPLGQQATDSDSDYLQCDHQDIQSTQKTETRTEESNQVDVMKGSADALSNERQQELGDLPESTSLHEHIINSSKSGEMELHIETASNASSGVDSLTERPHKLKDKTAKHDLSTTSSEGLLSRTSPRRARQVQSLSSESKDSFDNNMKDLPEEEEADTHPCARNKVRGEKTTPRKRARSTSSSVSPKKPLENQAADPVLPGSPKRRRTASVCRDLSQDFNTSKLADSDTPTPSLQTECNSELTPDPPETSIGEKLPESVSDAIDKIISKSNSVMERAAPVETSAPQRTRHRSGTSPRGTPHKHIQLDLTRSPSRRGLRSSGTVLEIPAPETLSEVTQGSEEVTPSSSPIVTHRKSSGKKKSSKKDATLEKDDSKGDEQGSLRIGVSREEVDYQAEDWFVDVDETEPFYFESDHMAIKGNKDYRMLLRTLTTLEAQRKQAVLDLDRLLEYNDKAVRNPIKFVHKLQHKDSLHLPNSQRVVTLPDIDWARYIGAPETNELLGLVHQPRSMRPSKTTSSAATAAPSSTTQTKPVTMAPPAVPASPTAVVPVNPDTETPSTSSTPDLMPTADASDSKHEIKVEMIRGRPSDESKSATFNQLWTRNEQRRLEECLLKFPMEDVEARRWEKIAKALGNRTPQQVASRVQKYFIKLMKAGMAVPGRLPNLTTYQNSKRTGKKMHPFTRPLYQPSTFLQSILPPVFMSDDDPYSYDLDGLDDDDDTISDDETIPSAFRNTPEYQELLKLKQIKKRKIREQGHVGYRCDGCEMEPIFGTRWHCLECSEEVSTDLCQNCVDCNFSSKHHSSTHRMEPVHTSYSQDFVDGDYTSFEPSVGDYNYLDPNYNPTQTT